jgi:hypothetical protein
MKKAIYIFLCSLMGALLFLILHNLVVFLYSVALTADYGNLSFGFSYTEFVAIDVITLFLALLGGSLYGIWLGLFWYQKIYEEASHRGFVDHAAAYFWPGSRHNYKLESKMEAAKKKLEDNLWQFEDLAKTAAAESVVPIKRRVSRKRNVTKKV